MEATDYIFLKGNCDIFSNNSDFFLLIAWYTVTIASHTVKILSYKIRNSQLWVIKAEGEKTIVASYLSILTL